LKTLSTLFFFTFFHLHRTKFFFSRNGKKKFPNKKNLMRKSSAWILSTYCKLYSKFWVLRHYLSNWKLLNKSAIRFVLWWHLLNTLFLIQVPRAKFRFEFLSKKFHPRLNLTTLFVTKASPPKHDKTIFRSRKLVLGA
jgi:hypothetical protein